MALNSLFLTLKGGAGSGNIGHAGIPGHRGGSAPQSFGTITKPEMLEHFQSWVDNLTNEERWPLDRWQGQNGRYKEIQAYLRAPDEAKQWIHKGDKWKDLADGIQSALVKGELPKNAVLWRIMNLPELHPKNGDTLIGTVFKDKGFTASTIDETYAHKFTAYVPKGYYVKINAKKGTKGAFMDSFRDMKESEFLMPQGTSFVITGVDKKNRTIEVEIE